MRTIGQAREQKEIYLDVGSDNGNGCIPLSHLSSFDKIKFKYGYITYV